MDGAVVVAVMGDQLVVCDVDATLGSAGGRSSIAGRSSQRSEIRETPLGSSFGVCRRPSWSSTLSGQFLVPFFKRSSPCYLNSEVAKNKVLSVDG